MEKKRGEVSIRKIDTTLRHLKCRLWSLDGHPVEEVPLIDGVRRLDRVIDDIYDSLLQSPKGRQNQLRKQLKEAQDLRKDYLAEIEGKLRRINYALQSLNPSEPNEGEKKAVTSTMRADIDYKMLATQLLCLSLTSERQKRQQKNRLSMASNAIGLIIAEMIGGGDSVAT